MERPDTIKRAVNFYDVESFVAYVTEFAEAARTRCYADAESGIVVALLDDHGVRKPDWCDHRARLKMRTTPEWDDWSKLNKRPMSQAEFGEFLEDHAKQIHKPDGATILSMAMDLHIHRAVKFRAAQRLKDGLTQFEAVQEDVSKADHVQIPDQIILRMAPYEASPAYEIPARIRYRIVEGGLQMWYALTDPVALLRQAFVEAVEEVRQALPTDVPVLMGCIAQP